MSSGRADRGQSDDYESWLAAIAAAPPKTPDAVPSRIAQFTIRGVLGRGGMGVVYRAHDEALRRDIALKLLPESGDEERRQRFLREARSAAAITHPNIAVVHQVGEDAGRVYIAMELVAGQSLRQRLSEQPPLDMTTALDLGEQIAEGLAAAHAKGIVHRDLKPENVMVTPDGVVKLLDFGLAKTSADSGPVGTTEAALAKTETLVISVEGGILGTPEYMSPEQAMGQPLDVRSDVFSFGIVLYEMLAGTRPFTGATKGAVLVAIARDPVPPLGERAPQVEARIEAVVNRCMAKAPADRFANGEEILGALRSKTSLKAMPLAGTDPAPVVPTGETHETRAKPRRPVMWLLGVLALVGAGVAWRASHQGASGAGAQVTSAAAPSASTRPIRFSDLPRPKTDNPEALREYERAMNDLYDAVEPPQNALNYALDLDPSFAAAYLRYAFFLDRPSSARAYGSAVRYRDKLDDRDRALLAAEEPCDLPELPDYAECKRRFAALADARPLDVEIQWRIGLIELRIAPGSELPTYEALARLDPSIAGAEAAVATALLSLNRVDEAKAHFQRCEELSPVAARCIKGEGLIAALDGQCHVFDDAVRRASAIAPNDAFNLLDRLNVSLTMNGSRAAAEAQIRVIDGATAHSNTIDGADRPPFGNFLRAEVALWFGDFHSAYEGLETFSRALQRFDSTNTTWSYEELVAAEEMADEAAARANLRTYMGEREHERWNFSDGLALRALRSHHALPEAQVAALREKWRGEDLHRTGFREWWRGEDVRRTGFPEWWTWLMFDSEFALTPEEARAALAKAPSSLPESKRALDTEYELGRLLLLAGRAADAAPRFERAAQSCAPFRGYETVSYVPFMVRASLDLGRAREALGDKGGACASYRRVLARWGDAKPRSVTADEARARAEKLSCPEL
jgi:serine/threonine-protein kinase